MSPGTRPAAVPSEIADESAIKAWLDALANGSCDAPAFLSFAQERIKADPDRNWEVLSQLDQYYRRGRINADTFQLLKNALAESALGARDIPVARDVAAHVAAHEPAHAAPTTLERPMEPETPLVETPAAREIPRAREIPLATDVVFPQATVRIETSSDHIQREPKQTEDAAGELKPGSVLRRRYRIESIVGRGSTGTVFQALDEYRLDVPPGGQRLALKVLHTVITKRAEALTELRREFQQLQLLSHPNILRVFEFDRDGPLVFFTMELLHGARLTRVLQKRKLIPLERAQALAAICDIGTAFAYAHSRGMVHGNISPQGIFVTTAGAFRVLDFGASHAWNAAPAAPDLEATLPSATAGFASCQVLEGQRPEARDDVFSLACVAYLLLCGLHPFSTKTAIEARDAGLKPRRPAKLTNQQWRTLRAGLSFDRAKRPPDIQQWLERFDLRGASKHLVPLAELLDPPSRTLSKSISKAALAAAVVLIVAAGYWFMRQPDGPPTHNRTLDAATAQSSTPPAAQETPDDGSTVAHDISTVPHDNSTVAHDISAAPVAVAPSAAAPTAAPSGPATSASTPAISSGPTKVELVSDAVDVPDSDGSAQVPVHRRGNLRGETSFTWWTESGTAKPGVDFSAIVPQIAHIGDGKSNINLIIPLTGTKRAQSKSFYVVIDQSEGGASLGGRTLTMVTLPGGE
jgi:serine/threonine protein kinase